MMKANFTVFPLLALLGAGAFAQKPPVHQVDPFVIDVNRPYVYLKFDHLGRGSPRGDMLRFRLISRCPLERILAPTTSEVSRCGSWNIRSGIFLMK